MVVMDLLANNEGQRMKTHPVVGGGTTLQTPFYQRLPSARLHVPPIMG